MIDVFDRDAGIGLVGADQVDAVYGVAGLAVFCCMALSSQVR